MMAEKQVRDDCFHRDPVVGATEVWPDARAVLADVLVATSWCTVCGALWLNPEQAETIRLEQSSMNNISLDPRMKQAQMEALASLENISDSGGMTNMDKANLSRIATDEQTRAKGARDAILQNAQARGIGGSGIEIMAQLQNQQDSATRNAQRDMDVAAMAQQRALDAIMQRGGMAGQMGQQDFNQQAQIAGANDAIAKFNAQNAQNQANMNTNLRNDAQARNLAVKQSISDANVGTRNQQQISNKQLPQQQFDNRITKAQGQAGIESRNQEAASKDSAARAARDNQVMGTALSFGGMFIPKDRDKEKDDK